MDNDVRKKVAGYLGLAQRAGKIAAGDTAAKEALIKKKACLIVLAEDAAISVKSELIKMAGTEIPVISWPDKLNLGMIVGKSRRGALALTDSGFAAAILKVVNVEKTAHK